MFSFVMEARFPLILVFLIVAIYIFIFAPSKRYGKMAAWRGTAFAHRGLHNESISENSLMAFERACAHGFGIELDVQLSKDGSVVVFHDDDLLRMTGDSRRVDAVDYSELKSMQLPDGSNIPLFEDVLRLVGGRVPLLVELKNGKRNAELCRKTQALLRAYKGRYIVESFNPMIVRWFRRHDRGVLRGQLVTDMKGYMPQFGKSTAWLLASLALNFLARPDFVAYDADCDFAAPKLQRILFKTSMACWTIKSAERFYQAKEMGEMPIFEGFLPDAEEGYPKQNAN